MYFHSTGRPEASVVQTHLSEIHTLKEKLKSVNDALKETKQKLKDLQDRIKAEKEESKVQNTLLQNNVELREMIQADERQKLEKENAAILKEKLDSLKLEIEQEKAELKVLYFTASVVMHTYMPLQLPLLDNDKLHTIYVYL